MASKASLIAPQDRLGLKREEAAAYIGVGATLFDDMVADGRMPRPRLANARRIWSRFELEAAFAKLPRAEGEEAPEDNPYADAHA